MLRALLAFKQNPERPIRADEPAAERAGRSAERHTELPGDLPRDGPRVVSGPAAETTAASATAGRAACRPEEAAARSAAARGAAAAAAAAAEAAPHRLRAPQVQPAGGGRGTPGLLGPGPRGPVQELVPLRPPALDVLEEGKELYKRGDMSDAGGHLSQTREVHGNVKEGCDSLCIGNLVRGPNDPSGVYFIVLSK